jgi:CubicO group peptidase (beta-lactamase class C family)
MTAPAIATAPEDVGVDSERLEAVFARVKRDVDDGILPSASVAVARQGRLAGFRVYGQALQGGAMRPATDQTLYTIFSSTKAIVSAAAWTLIEDGLLRLDERVAEIIPEFGTNGKDVVTVEQAFLHIGGFPLAPLGPGRWETREGRVRAFSDWRLNWEPGTKFEYHATSLHWVLAEIIERRTGVEFRQFVRQRILEPMGIADQMFLGLPAELNARVADVLHVVPPTPPPGGWGEVTPDAILRFNEPAVRAVGVPGGGGVGTAAGLALFYQPLINGGVTADATRVMKAETIEYATTPRTKDFHVDLLFQKPINRALGVVVAGDRENMVYRGFGRTASPRAFGHGGAGGQIGWGDPETGISLGYCTNGFVDDEMQGRRGVAVSSLAAVCAKA